MKKFILSTLVATLGIVFFTGNVTLALSNTDIDINHAYQKNDNKYDVVIHEKAYTDVGIYVNDKNPVFAKANESDWATFKGVSLEGTKGKISFTIVFYDNGKTYQFPVNYVRYYNIADSNVGFSENDPEQVPFYTAPPVASAPAADSSSSQVTPPAQQCTNGTYTNSRGETVCSPEVSTQSVPSGATAQCVDGTYSFSQHRSGTCSHHGGGANWL